MSENKVKVSIVIPVYNVEEFLPACLDSVLAQTLKEIEVICVDDCSPDRCPEILDEYAKNDIRVKVIHLPENSQQAFARNRGMEIATGKYLYLLDSDDMITQNAMEELYEYAEEFGLDGVFFDSQVIYETEALAKKHAFYPAARHGAYEDRIYTGPELYNKFIRQQEWNCYIQRQFWNREYLVRNNIWFPERQEHEDEVFSFTGILCAEQIKYLKKDYFIRRYRDDSVVTSPPAPKNFYGYFKCFQRMTEFVAQKESCSCKEEKNDIEKNGSSGQNSHGSGGKVFSEEERFSINVNIGRMYAKMVNYYEMLSEKNDLSAWFKTAEEQMLFRLFEQTQKSSDYYQNFTAGISGYLKSRSKVYIYGAGINARAVYKGLCKECLPVEGFFVTDPAKNPDILFGRPVKKLRKAGLK